MNAILFISIILSAPYAMGAQACECKCVIQDPTGKISIITGNGKDREKAGEDLKKNLQSDKCELSPTCSGKCSLDE